MTNSSNIHWTSNEHLLARYVLGRLDALQESVLREHLKDCPQCREVVAAEEELAAGIRRAGRDELKARLSVAIGERSTATNWYRIAGIAAAFVLLITIGVYNDWFFPDAGRIPESHLKSDSLTPQSKSSPRQLTTERELTDKLERAEAPKPAQQTSRELGRSGSASEVRSDSKAETAMDEGRGAPSVSAPVGRYAMPRRKDQSPLAAPPGEVWLQGGFLDVEQSVDLMKNAMGKGVDSAPMNLQKEKRESKSVLSLAARTQSPLPQGIVVSVTQRPFSDLPPIQARRQNASLVPTRLQSGVSGISLVLYSDSVFPRIALSQAHLTAVRGDSVILRVGNRQIGYRLPPGISEDIARQLRVAK